MTVELIPNPERYEDVYPSDSDDEAEDEDIESENSDPEDASEIKACKQELAEIDNEFKKAHEEKLSSIAQLAMLDGFARGFEKYDKEQPPDVTACVATYRDERRKIFELHFESENTIMQLSEERAKSLKNLAKARRSIEKEKEKAYKERAKRLQKQWRAREDKLTAKRRLDTERAEFWPKKIYKVTVTLDTNSDFTPTSSRRGSTTSLTKTLTEESSPNACEVSLSLSYITTSAWWSPRYDLSVNTSKNSGLLIYRAEFCNMTSETWKDAKINLSTSQTSFQGLGDPIPEIIPWHIRLNKAFGSFDGTGEILLSAHEKNYKQKKIHDAKAPNAEPRAALIGLGNKPLNAFDSTKNYTPQQIAHPHQQFQQLQAVQMSMPVPGGGLFGNSNNARAVGFGASQPSLSSNVQQPGSLFGNSNNSQASSFGAMTATGGNLFGSNVGRPSHRSPPDLTASNDAQLPLHSQPAEELLHSDLPSLEQPEASWSETGLTATHDIPGVRTVKPSHNKLRLRIASVAFSDVHLAHVIVPKLRLAAFLKARFWNKSSISLLRGPAGLTLDGSFLGNTQIPHCSAGEQFSLSLGVDPGIQVTYAQPTVKRSQSGVFTKDNSGLYTRTCTITNTKSNRALEATVLDQIPVSEDERLKIDVLSPAGLTREGEKVATGTPVVKPGNKAKDEKWGRAHASLRKDGEVAWDLRLEPSRGVKLALEYETRFPSTETVASA